MATFSFTNRTTRLQQAVSTRRAGPTAAARVTAAPSTGAPGFKYKLFGIYTADDQRKVRIDSTEAEGVVSAVADAIYYNDAELNELSQFVFMDIYVNGFYRASIEFAKERLNTEFAYSLNSASQISPLVSEEGFRDYQVLGVFTEGDYNIELADIVITTPLPTSTPQPTPTITGTPEPTPTVTVDEFVFPTPEPTLNEPTATPYPTETPTATPAPTASATPAPTATVTGTPEPTPTPSAS